MRYLIDGYNLLFALGKLLKSPRGVVLEQARLYLFRLLREAHREEVSGVTVVFDARTAPPGAPREVTHQGINIRFAVGHPEADDLIEEMIRTAPAPGQLTVVSDDHRLRQCGTRRGCRVMGCGEYMDWLEKARRPPPAPSDKPLPTKPEAISREEMQHWVEEFGELESDPEWKELFDLPWGDADSS